MTPPTILRRLVRRPRVRLTRLPQLVGGRRAAATDRGASGVEYALLVGFFVVALLGSIDALQTNAGDRLEDRAAEAAAPVERNGHFGPRETIPPTPGGETPNPEPPPTGLASVELGGGTSVAVTGGHWDGSVTVTTRDPDGNPLGGVRVVLSVTGRPTQELVTSSSGTVTYTASKVHKHDSVTFAVDIVEAEGYTFAEPFPSLTLSAPN